MHLGCSISQLSDGPLSLSCYGELLVRMLNGAELIMFIAVHTRWLQLKPLKAWFSLFSMETRLKGFSGLKRSGRKLFPHYFIETLRITLHGGCYGNRIQVTKVVSQVVS